MRRAATRILFALIATVMAFAQTQPATSNNPATKPQAQTPATPNNGTSPQPAPPSADIPQANDSQSQTSGQENAQGSTVIQPALGLDQAIAGTEIHAALDTPLSTKTSKSGDRFTATITDPVRGGNGAIVIPSGSRVEGEVADTEESKTLAALRGKGKLDLRFRDLVLPNGQNLPLTATLISVHDTSGTNSKSSGKESQSARNKDIATDAGSGAGAGADTGLVFGGPLKGLAIGTLAGGGYVLATKSKNVNLPAQTGMVIRLDQPVSSSAASVPPQR
ncbi:MAG TPA: hypothetical protein VGJ33_13555 [Candidatus Angelobacter sp.]|jgi:hypothetical protein